MGHVDHRPVPPLDPPADTLSFFPASAFGSIPAALKASPSLRSISTVKSFRQSLSKFEIDAFRRFADLRHHAFDQLVAAGETPEALDIVGGRGRGRPKSPKPPRPLRALRPRRRAARSRRHGCRGTNRLGRASSDELALQPDAFCALHHIDLRERVAVAVGAGVSIVKLDLGP